MSTEAPILSQMRRRFSVSVMGFVLLGATLWCLRQIPLGTAEAQAPAAKKVYAPVRPVAAPAARSGNTATTPTATNAPISPPDSKTIKVMAVVNGEQITRDELGHECVRRYGEEILEAIVNRQLIQNACLKANVTISEQDIDDEIARIAAKFKLPVERWMDMLKEERGVNKEQYRREIIWPTLALRALAAEKIQVTPADLQKAFETEYGPRARVRIIGTSRETKAREALAKARANPNAFADIAKQYCEDPNIASVGGAIPPIRKHMGDIQLEQAAFALKPGQISDVVAAQNQFFVIFCEGQDPETFVSPQQAKQVEGEMRDRIRDQKLKTASQELFAKLQKDAQVVNVYNQPQLRAQQPGVAATINNQPITMALLASECIDRHGRDVLDGEINRKLLQQTLTRQSVAVSQQDLDAEVDRAALLYNCVKQDGSPDREKWLKQVQEQDGASIELYIRDAVWPSVALKKLVQNRVAITQEDLQKGFESNYGPRVEVLAIVFSNQRQAQQVWEMARNNPTDRYFGELATQYSVEPVSRANSGKVPPIRKYGGQPIVETEAFKLKTGELSTILSIADKYVLLRCLGRTQPVVSSIEEVRKELEIDLRDKKTNAEMSVMFEQIRENSQIDNFLVGTSQTGKRASSSAMRDAGPATNAATPRVGSLPTTPVSRPKQ
jgi:parvulin-like peptidyl-prolyl isomerase